MFLFLRMNANFFRYVFLKTRDKQDPKIQIEQLNFNIQQPRQRNNQILGIQQFIKQHVLNTPILQLSKEEQAARNSFFFACLIFLYLQNGIIFSEENAPCLPIGKNDFKGFFFGYPQIIREIRKVVLFWSGQYHGFNVLTGRESQEKDALWIHTPVLKNDKRFFQFVQACVIFYTEAEKVGWKKEDLNKLARELSDKYPDNPFLEEKTFFGMVFWVIGIILLIIVGVILKTQLFAQSN
jgi:hypothetical protein